MSTIVHLPNLPEKTQPHFAYSVWCQKDHTFGFHPFRTIERKPRHTSSVPALPAVGQKEMKNAGSYVIAFKYSEAKIGERIFKA